MDVVGDGVGITREDEVVATPVVSSPMALGSQLLAPLEHPVIRLAIRRHSTEALAQTTDPELIPAAR